MSIRLAVSVPRALGLNDCQVGSTGLTLQIPNCLGSSGGTIANIDLERDSSLSDEWNTGLEGHGEGRCANTEGLLLLS